MYMLRKSSKPEVEKIANCHLYLQEAAFMTEAIGNWHHGFLAEVYDFEEQANCILRIARDFELAEMMRTNAREKLMEKFTIQKQMEKFISVFQSIKKKNKPA